VEKKRAGLVTLFDVTPLLPLTKELATDYKHVSMSCSRKATCSENAQIAKNHKKLAVSHIWSICSVISDYTCSYNHSDPDRTPIGEEIPDDEDLNWFFYHPFGSELIHNM